MTEEDLNTNDNQTPIEEKLKPKIEIKPLKIENKEGDDEDDDNNDYIDDEPVSPPPCSPSEAPKLLLSKTIEVWYILEFIIMMSF